MQQRYKRNYRIIAAGVVALALVLVLGACNVLAPAQGATGSPTTTTVAPASTPTGGTPVSAPPVTPLLARLLRPRCNPVHCGWVSLNPGDGVLFGAPGDTPLDGGLPFFFPPTEDTGGGCGWVRGYAIAGPGWGENEAGEEWVPCGLLPQRVTYDLVMERTGNLVLFLRTWDQADGFVGVPVWSSDPQLGTDPRTPCPASTWCGEDLTLEQDGNLELLAYNPADQSMDTVVWQSGTADWGSSTTLVLIPPINRGVTGQALDGGGLYLVSTFNSHPGCSMQLLGGLGPHPMPNPALCSGS